MPTGSATKTPLKIFFASGSGAQSMTSEARSWSRTPPRADSRQDMAAVLV